MATLPSTWQWLRKEGGPKMIVNALKEYGTLETPGSGNNPKILQWAKEVGLNKLYTNDAIPWCGLFMAVIAKRSDKPVVKDPLWAMNWGTFGHHIAEPGLGDILVFTRKTSNGTTAGHVGLYVAETPDSFYVLGGNQSDSVTISQVKKNRLYQSRRPDYHIQPEQVRRIFLTASGGISTNES
jgi:uncharacterized protein (TIGR02594 family)